MYDNNLTPEVQEQLEARLAELMALPTEHLTGEAIDALGAEIVYLTELLSYYQQPAQELIAVYDYQRYEARLYYVLHNGRITRPAHVHLDKVGCDIAEAEANGMRISEHYVGLIF